MENRTFYQVTYLNNKRYGYIYKDAFALLSYNSLKKMQINILSEFMVKQGRITDKLEEAIYLVNVINKSNKRDLADIYGRLIQSTAISEDMQIQLNKADLKWLEKQKTGKNEGSFGILNIIANKFCNG